MSASSTIVWLKLDRTSAEAAFSVPITLAYARGTGAGWKVMTASPAYARAGEPAADSHCTLPGTGTGKVTVTPTVRPQPRAAAHAKTYTTAVTVATERGP